MHAEHNTVMADPSVCTPHFAFVSERMHISSNSFHHLVGAWHYFLSFTIVTKFRREPLSGALNTLGWEIFLRFLTEVAVYLGNGTI